MAGAQPDDANAMGQFSTQPLPGKKGSLQVLRGDELFQYVVYRLEAGTSKHDLCAELVAMGYSAAEAEPWVEKVVAWRRKHSEGLPQYPQAPGHAETKANDDGAGWFGPANMRMGGGVFLLGIGLTIISYQGAQQGGSYYYAYHGAIVWGTLQFLLGLWYRNR